MEGDRMSKVKIGDKVTYTNPNGVVFPGHTVVGFCDWDWDTFKGRVFIDSDSPWFPVEESSLTIEGGEIK
jgi:hypothetical protein